MNFRMSPGSAGPRSALALALALGLGPVAPYTLAQEAADDQTIMQACAVINGGREPNQFECQGFLLRYGESKELSSDLALSTSLEFDRGQLQLAGNVRIRIGSSELSADRAVSLSLADELEKFELVGSPVVLSDFIEESGVPIRAEAGLLAYDRSTDTVTMRGEVSFVRGTDGNSYKTCFLSFNLTTKEFALGMPNECGSTMSLDRASVQEAGDEQSDGP